MDRRQKKTRQAIIDAFVKLLTKTSYEKVSVKDIIKPYPLSRTFSKEREKQRPLLESLLLIFY